MAKNISQLFRSLKDRQRKWPSRTETILSEQDGWRTAHTAALYIWITGRISRCRFEYALWLGETTFFYGADNTAEQPLNCILRPYHKFDMTASCLFQQSQRGNNCRFVRHPGPGVYCTINFQQCNRKFVDFFCGRTTCTEYGNPQLLVASYFTDSEPRCGFTRGMYRPAKSTCRRKWWRPLSMLKVNFSMLYLISEVVAGLSYRVVSSVLQVSYQGTKFCFSLYFPFN